MHLIVVGCGRVGCLLAQQMVAEGHSVSVIDKNPQRTATIRITLPQPSLVMSFVCQM